MPPINKRQEIIHRKHMVQRNTIGRTEWTRTDWHIDTAPTLFVLFGKARVRQATSVESINIILSKCKDAIEQHIIFSIYRVEVNTKTLRWPS